MFEKFKRMDQFTRILLVSCGVLLVLSITLGIVIGVKSNDQDQDPKPVLTTADVTTGTSVTTATTTTNTITTTTTEETTTTETEEPVSETEAPVEEVIARKTTAAPVEDEPEDEPDPEPVKTESPKVEEPEPTEDPGYYYCWDEGDNYNYGRKIYTKPVTMYIVSDDYEVPMYTCPDEESGTNWVINRGEAVTVFSELDGYASAMYDCPEGAQRDVVRGHIRLENLSLVKVDYPAPTA